MSEIERWTMVLTPCGDLRASGFDWCEPLESCCMRDRSKAVKVEVVRAAAYRGAVEALRKYADHLSNCPARDAGVRHATCSCGVNAMLRAECAR